MVFCAILVLCAAPAASSAAADKPMTETEKIEALIHAVDTLEGAVFIRNGKEYDCHAAADHMRTKWNWKKGEIKTARDFIRLAATSSSMSGKDYVIRFKDGREVKAADFLLAELEKLEGKQGKGGG
jgi:GH43 family beta-xylosidase